MPFPHSSSKQQQQAQTADSRLDANPFGPSGTLSFLMKAVVCQSPLLATNRVERGVTLRMPYQHDAATDDILSFKTDE